MRTRVLPPTEAFRCVYTNPSSTVGIAAGTPVITDDGTVYVAVDAILPGGSGVLERGGVYEFPKAAGTTLAAGTHADWSGSAVVASGGIYGLGRVYEPAPSAQTFVRVQVSDPFGTFRGTKVLSAGEITARSAVLGRVPTALVASGTPIYRQVFGSDGNVNPAAFDVDVAAVAGTNLSELTLTWASGVTVAANSRVGWFIFA